MMKTPHFVTTRVCILVLIFCAFASVITLAQTTIDVLYLKNGSIIKGTIVEQVIGQSLKIRTRDGSIFAFKMEEIEKIVKEDETPRAQQGETQSPTSEPLKSRLGLQLGLFSIALDDFDQIYGSSSSFTFGIEGQWLFSDQFGTSSRFRYFSKSGQPLTYTSGGLTISNQKADWTEYWLVIGLKAHFKTESKVTPFLGAGAAYFNIKESISGTASYQGSQQPFNVSISDNTWGFALFGGAKLLVSNSVYLVAEGEFTSASIKGQGGVGGQETKVGGFFFDVGLEVAF